MKRYFKSFEHMKSFFTEPITFGCRVKTDYDVCATRAADH